MRLAAAIPDHPLSCHKFVPFAQSGSLMLSYGAHAIRTSAREDRLALDSLFTLALEHVMFASCSSEVRRHSRVFAATVQRETVLGSRLSACQGSGGQPSDAGHRSNSAAAACRNPPLPNQLFQMAVTGDR